MALIVGEFMNILQLFGEYLTKQIELFEKQLCQYSKYSEREKWDIEIGRKFNALLYNYPISDDELIKMSKVLCDYVLHTRNTDIEQYFFLDKNKEIVRLPFMLNGLRIDQINSIIYELSGEMNIDEKGNDVLLGGSEDYENKWKYQIGENYGLQKAIKIIKKHCFEEQLKI